ncbi:MAG: hypothetical protein PHS41_09525 [Victivallaceae bacterium]|nr:hypothetical protein [Victivallaceae bacterium]
MAARTLMDSQWRENFLGNANIPQDVRLHRQNTPLERKMQGIPGKKSRKPFRRRQRKRREPELSGVFSGFEKGMKKAENDLTSCFGEDILQNHAHP